MDKYIAKVTEEPTAAELKKLYEKGKYQFPDPTGEEPGFKIGRKVNVQYLVADFETYLQNEMNKLSDEEVQKEYERLVEEEDDLVMEPVPIEDNSIKLNDATPGETESDPAPNSGDSDAAAPGDEAAPSDVTPPPGSEDGGGSSSDNATDSETPAAETPSSEPAEGDGNQSRRVQSSKFQFVSTEAQQEQPDEGKTEAKATGADEADSGKQDEDVGGIGAIEKDVEAGAADEKKKIELDSNQTKKNAAPSRRNGRSQRSAKGDRG